MSKHSELVHLVAEAEAARLVLENLILRGVEGEQLARAVANRVAAIEAVSGHYSPVSDSAFVPPADRRVPHQRRHRKKPDSAA